jgi:hypothetical protein
MAVAIVLDFPGGTREQYDQVVAGMDLGGMLPPGAIHHTAGSTGEGWRVVDVWESTDRFQRFADEQIRPLSAQAGLGEPRTRVVELHNAEQGSGEPTFLQVFRIPIDAQTYDEVHQQIAQPLPEGIVWHVAGPQEDGWCIIDAWTDKALRDRFINEVAVPRLQASGVQGPPEVEELDVQATLRSGAGAASF